MDIPTEQLIEAINTTDIDGAVKAIDNGANVNTTNSVHESPLQTAINLDSSTEIIVNILKILLDNGANPNHIDTPYENIGVLFDAGLTQNAEIMEVLLSNGGNPNLIMLGPQSLYDYCEFDYSFRAFNMNKYPIEPTEIDKEDSNTWLAFLYKCAEKANKSKPDFLRVMRKYGAKTLAELEGK
jgi:hypothetical protein